MKAQGLLQESATSGPRFDLTGDDIPEENGEDIGYSTFRFGRMHQKHGAWLQAERFTGGDYSAGAGCAGDTVARSNYECLVKLCEASDAPGVWWARTSGGHGTYGLVFRLDLVPEDIAEAIIAVEGYPLLNDDHHSNLESEAANKVWQTCYSYTERLEYIRKHRSQFEFQGFADLMGCVRGKYFAGYASELLT